MKKFLAVYYGTQKGMESWLAFDEKTRKEREAAGIQAWTAWVQKNEKSIVGVGAPLGKTKRVDKSGVSETKNELTAFTLVEAESHEAAAQLFLGHPHFTVFPGEFIEVMECLPIPGK